MRPGHADDGRREAMPPVCYDVRVTAPALSARSAWLGAWLLLGGLTLGGCHGQGASVHWPKSAGAITPDDPADDGGESLAPRGVSDQAAAIEHGGDDITIILDEPSAIDVVPPAPPAPASSGQLSPADLAPDGIPVFEDTIIIQAP